MNKLTIALVLAALTGCASKPETPNAALIVEKEVQPMSRNEVIIAIQECESSGLRAVLVMSKRRIADYKSDVVVDVTCAPRFRF